MVMMMMCPRMMTLVEPVKEVQAGAIRGGEGSCQRPPGTKCAPPRRKRDPQQPGRRRTRRTQRGRSCSSPSSQCSLDMLKVAPKSRTKDRERDSDRETGMETRQGKGNQGAWM